jgi:hypothetical protein
MQQRVWEARGGGRAVVSGSRNDARQQSRGYPPLLQTFAVASPAPKQLRWPQPLPARRHRAPAPPTLRSLLWSSHWCEWCCSETRGVVRCAAFAEPWRSSACSRRLLCCHLGQWYSLVQTTCPCSRRVRLQRRADVVQAARQAQREVGASRRYVQRAR